METRKIQSIGGSSFSLTLPKKWVNFHKLKDKDFLNISQIKSGGLMISPLVNKKSSPKKVSIDGSHGEELYREIIVLYILGFDQLELEAKVISLAQRKVVRSATQKLAGMEIMEESSSVIYIKSLLDPEKFSFTDYIQKMFLTTRLMFTDSVNSFLNSNRELAADIIDRDFEVDKIDFLISRMKHSIMLGKISEEKLSASLTEANFYENIAKQLERMADHSVKIARLVEKNNFPANKNLEKSLRLGAEIIISLFQESEQFIKNVDKKLANKILQTIREKPAFSELYYEGVKSSFAPAVILSDSFDRMMGYMGNMAEYTLAQAMMS